MYINIAFCFDHNLIRQVQVAAASLLDHARTERVHYHIYCICTEEASLAEDRLRRIVRTRDRESVLTVKVAENLYQDAYEVRGISSGAYLRLMLHRLLPQLDKILYTDVDVLFQSDLTNGSDGLCTGGGERYGKLFRQMGVEQRQTLLALPGGHEGQIC